jgi:hypothetical protein
MLGWPERESKMNKRTYRPIHGCNDSAPYVIEYTLPIQRVVFERFNKEAGVSERVSIHWTEAFKWADSDPCGGLSLCAVQLADGSECFAKGRYFNPEHPANKGQHGLCAIHVGAYGDACMWRVLRSHDPAVGVGDITERMAA